MNINIHSPTGGTGCSTIAATIALHLNDPEVVGLIEQRDDNRRILGVKSDNAVVPLDETLELNLPPTTTAEHLNAYIDGVRERYAHTVTDWGTTVPVGEGINIVVVTNTYLNLSRYRTLRDNGHRDHFAVAVLDDRLSLSIVDASTVLGCSPDIVIPHDMAIARSVDAGLLATRPPKELATQIATLINTIGKNK